MSNGQSDESVTNAHSVLLVAQPVSPLPHVPSHVSAAVHWFTAESPHAVPAAAQALAGHAAADPVQRSATSQTPAEARQTVAVDLKASAGHAAADPVQFSAMSQTPFDGRQTVLEDTNALLGQ
jgi:hypothetical protein